jgi:signal transduction histidine kinase
MPVDRRLHGELQPKRRIAARTGTILMAISLLLGTGLVLVSLANYRDAVHAGRALAEHQGVEIMHQHGLLGCTAPLRQRFEAAFAAHALRHVSLWNACSRVFVLGTSAFPTTPCPTPMELQRDGDRARMTFPARTLGADAIRLSSGAGKLGDVTPLTAVVIEFDAPAASSFADRALFSLWLGCALAAVLTSAALIVERLGTRARRLAEEVERQRHDATLGTLSSVLAHELRNPLAALKGNLQLLAEVATGPRAQARSQRALRSVMKLETVVRELLAFARSGNLQLTPTSPAAVLHAAVEATASDQIKVSTFDVPALQRLDGHRLQQALVNLLDNALQATPAGLHVEATATQEDSDLVFYVRDHGPGVPPADRARIFEPFFTTRFQGTGLGLAIAKRIVEMHGGQIAVDSALGGGALFTIRVPIVDSQARVEPGVD